MYKTELSEELKAYYEAAKIENDLVIISGADSVARLLIDTGRLYNEVFTVLYLDSGNGVIEKVQYEGTTNRCAVYPREVIKKALECCASSLIMSHNHPGCTIEASEADWKVTKQIKQAADLFEIALLDHVIITGTGHNSLRNSPRWGSL